MSCNIVRQFLLKAGWDAEGRTQAAEFLRHLEQCEACQAAVEDFDVIRVALAPTETPEPAGGWEAMQRRIAGPLAIRRPRHHWFGGALAIAASVLVAGGVFMLGHYTAAHSNSGTGPLTNGPTTPPVQVGAHSATEPASAPPSDMTHEVQAFRQVIPVYDGHASWMMVSQNSSDVGTTPELVSPAKKVLVLRLDLLHGKDVVSNSDLLVLAGQKADMTVPLPSGESLHYRIGTSSGEPTQLTLWLELKTPHGGEPLAAFSTNLQLRRGQKLTAGKFATSAGEYELKIEFASTELSDGKP